MEIISCLRSKATYLKKFKKYGTNHYRNMFNQYRSRSKTLIDTRFRLYIDNMHATLSTDPKKFWNFIQQTTTTRIPRYKHHDITLCMIILQQILTTILLWLYQISRNGTIWRGRLGASHFGAKPTWRRDTLAQAILARAILARVRRYII